MDYIFKPMSYVLVIMLGYLLKRAGFFGKDDHRLMSKIMVNITLPCTIIQAFDGFERDAKMFIIVGIGFICAFMPILLMYLTTGRVEKRLRAYRMLNIGDTFETDPPRWLVLFYNRTFSPPYDERVAQIFETEYERVDTAGQYQLLRLKE